MKKRVFALGLALLLCLGLATPAMAICDMGKIGEFQTISSNGSTYMAIDDRGTLWSWTERSSPERKMDHVSSVSCGKDFTMAIKTDGTLWSWGGNHYGQLGQGTDDLFYSEQDYLERSTIPVKIMDNVAAVSAGEYYAMAIQTDGTLWAWGTNQFGQLGSEPWHSAESAPVKVMDDVAAVSAGTGSTLAVKTDGTLWAWGWNGTSKNTGVLGFSGANEIREYGGNIYSQTVPRQVYGIDDVVAISNGGNTFMALKSDGTLWSWGIGSDGGAVLTRDTPVYLGYNSTNRGYNFSFTGAYIYLQTFPKQVTDRVSAVYCAMAGGRGYTMAIRTDGTLWAWGFDDGTGEGILGSTRGDVGIRVTNDTVLSARGWNWQSVPRKIEQISNVAEICDGLIRKSDGTLWQLIKGSFAPIELSDFIVSEDGRLEAYIGIDEDVIIPDKVTVVGSDIFSGNTDLTGVTIPDSVTAIEANAFSGCAGLTDVTISNNVTVIEANTFFGCTSLTSVTIPNGVTRIGNGAFANCTDLASIVIPDGVTRIGSGAFSGCTSLTSVTIPDSVTEISPDAFADCISLIDVTAPKKDGVTDGVFDGTPYQEKAEARHRMTVTMLVIAAVAVVILVILLELWKRKKNPELYAQKKLEQEKRLEEKRAEQAAEEEARKKKLAEEERTRKEQQAAAQAKRRIEAVLAGTVTCSCGVVNPATAKFCQGCGKPVVVPGRCPACGHQNDPAAKFCQGCGKPLDGGEGGHEA